MVELFLNFVCYDTPLLAAIGFFVDGWGIITLKIPTLITDTPPLAVVGIFIFATVMFEVEQQLMENYLNGVS